VATCGRVANCSHAKLRLARIHRLLIKSEIPSCRILLKSPIQPPWSVESEQRGAMQEVVPRSIDRSIYAGCIPRFVGGKELMASLGA
jgi:hypothetical protein